MHSIMYLDSTGGRAERTSRGRRSREAELNSLRDLVRWGHCAALMTFGRKSQRPLWVL
jgi:hypothetical protein